MKDGEFCPLIKKKCVQHKCAWYTQVRGTNPNTGQEVDEWKCAVSWMPMMAVEIAQKSNQTGAAVCKSPKSKVVCSCITTGDCSSSSNSVSPY
jgi:hypothetical protein